MEYKLAQETWNQDEYDAIQNVINTGQYSMGPMVENYEKDFAHFFGSKYCVMCSSGSTANLLMIASLFFTKDKNIQLKRGDEVIVPAVSWSTTFFPLQQYGLKVKFVDIDKDTLNFDLGSLKKAISINTKVIFSVNLLGNPNNFKEIKQLINNKKITLLEDNCESMGAKFNGQFAGTFGLMGTFSSFMSHHISTMEGGCILTSNEELYHILLTLRAHGWTRNLPDKNLVTGQKDSNPFNESFKFVLPGYNVRPLEMSGAIGLEQLKKLPGFLMHRSENAKYFIDRFSKIPFLRLQQEVGESSWFGFSLILEKDSPISRPGLIKRFQDCKVECRPIVSGNFVKNSDVLRYFDYSVHGDLHNASYLEDNGLFIGNHHFDAKDGLDYVYNVIKESY